MRWRCQLSEVARIEGHGDLLSTRLRLTHGTLGHMVATVRAAQGDDRAARVPVVEDDVDGKKGGASISPEPDIRSNAAAMVARLRSSGSGSARTS